MLWSYVFADHQWPQQLIKTENKLSELTKQVDSRLAERLPNQFNNSGLGVVLTPPFSKRLWRKQVSPNAEEDWDYLSQAEPQ